MEQEIIESAKEVREAQKKYWRLQPGTTQKRDALKESVRLEKKLDKLLDDYYSKQLSIFGE